MLFGLSVRVICYIRCYVIGIGLWCVLCCVGKVWVVCIVCCTC